MNIYFVSAIFPYPLYSGGQVRIYNLLKRLSDEHKIHLFSFIRDEKENLFKKELPFCESITTIYRGGARQLKYLLRAATGPYPWLMATYENQLMKEAISRSYQLHPCDVLHVEPGYVWSALPDLPVPIVVSEHNIEHKVYEGYVEHFPIPFLRPILSTDVAKLQRWEKIIWGKATHVTTVSDSDKQFVSSQVTSKNISVVANGVDVLQFPFKPRKTIDRKSLQFFFVGNFSWMQNREAADYLLKSLWPNIHRKYPGSFLKIVGKHFPTSLHAYLNSSVQHIEFVENIQKELQASDILLAPLHVGGGTKYKVLEAMGSGLPVITTTKGGEGLNVTHRENILIADTIEDTYTSIEYLLREDARMKLAIQARKIIENHYSWDTICTALDDVWKRVYEKK